MKPQATLRRGDKFYHLLVAADGVRSKLSPCRCSSLSEHRFQSSFLSMVTLYALPSTVTRKNDAPDA